MPENFHEKVLELELQVEKQRPQVEEAILSELIDLYTGAIEYYGYNSNIIIILTPDDRIASVERGRLRSFWDEKQTHSPGNG